MFEFVYMLAYTTRLVNQDVKIKIKEEDKTHKNQEKKKALL